MADVIGDDEGWDKVQAELDRSAVPAFGWASVAVVPPSGVLESHIVPLGDTAEHMLAPQCRCGVFEDPQVDGCYVHRAWDGREAYTPAGRKHH